MYTEKPWSLYEYLVISLTNAIVEITNARLQCRIKIVRRLEEAETQYMALTLFLLLLALKMEHTKNESVCANWRKMEWFYTPHLVIMKNMEARSYYKFEL